MQELQAVVFVQKASGRGITGFAEILRLSSGLMCTESCLATHCRALISYAETDTHYSKCN